ncbi:MAG TPA: A24 family peptidase [Candidatus Nitrosotalea sp.]|nr:A24 family peptidase [Candidatus Nitrosotalea sp.]
MTSILIPVLWAFVGAAGGWLVRWGSVRLARLEELEPGNSPWQVYGPPILSAVLFAIFATHVTAIPLLALRSLFVLVLVQVIFFDFEHRLILDRVIFPAMALALVVSLFGHPWWAGIASGLAVGLVFLLLGLVGQAIFKAEALGFGDVKLALFMGLLVGWPSIVQAVFYGVLLAGLASVWVIIRNRSMKGTIAYGPYLAGGTLIVLYLLPE